MTAHNRPLPVLAMLMVVTAAALAGPDRPVEADLHHHLKDAFKNPAEGVDKPRVLIIGDSISLGYTNPVRVKLKDRALVMHPPVNCQDTAYGLTHIKRWLGTGKWDVIHFNWGIWDTHLLTASGKLIRTPIETQAQVPLHIRHTPEQYRANLTRLVEILEATGARLIWASTTPIMSRTVKRFEDIQVLNKVAAEVMLAHHIEINNLYDFVLPHVTQWQAPDKVHFNALGNENLSEIVSKSILHALESRIPAK